MLRVFLLTIQVIVLTTLLSTLTYAQQFVVETVCIVPRDAERPDQIVIDRFKSVIEDVRHFYKKEMERHGYGSKTFRLKTDVNGNPTVRIINGKYRKFTYTGSTPKFAIDDLPNNKNVYVVLIAGVSSVANGFRGVGRITLDNWRCGGCKGYAYFAEKDGSFEFSSIAHEIGHALGLWHNQKGQEGDTTYLMWNGDEKLGEHEARWLNASAFFNRGFTADSPPKSTKVHAFEAFRKDRTDYISLKIDITGKSPLYQAQVFRSSDHVVLSWDSLSGHSDTAEFQMRKSDLLSDNKVFIHFIDSRGNQNLHSHPLTIPLDLEVVNTVVETVVRKPLGAKAYLAIVDADVSHTFFAINSSWQWAYHLQAVWEKPFGDVLPPKPFDCVHPSQNVPEYIKWDCFFYSHANSLIVWDISETDYNTFDGYVYLPNPCGDYASFEVSFLADYKELYNSGEIRVKDQGTHISFEIPEGTGILQLEVFDLGDPGCDHYILANPTLFRSDTFTAPSLHAIKIATTWGELKSKP